MRQITIDFDKLTIQGLIDNKYAGYLGEHKSTEVVIIKPADLVGASYSVAFQTNGEVYHSEFFADGEEIRVAVWQELTQDNTLYVQLEAYDKSGDYLGKSNVAKLNLGGSVHGVDVVADADNPDVYAEISLNTMFRETLEDNVDTLDKLTTSENGKLLFNGKPIEGSTDSSGGGLTEEQTADLALNTEFRKILEDNADALDKLTLAENGELLFDGQPIKAEGVVENANPYATMAQTIALLLESSEIYVSVESPAVASTETSLFANFMLDIVSGSTVLYAPPENGELTYTDVVNYEPVTISVAAGGIYEFYLDMDIYEVKVNSYVGVGILNFFKSKLLTEYVTEKEIDNKIHHALEEGDFVTNEQLNEKLLSISGLSVEVVDDLPEENINISTIYLISSSVNAIKTSLDMFGEDVYNGKGYAENTIYVPAFGEDTEKDGVFITGFIPIVGGDTFTLKNIEYNRDNADCKVYILAYAGATPVTPTADELTTSYEAKWDSEGNLISFKLPSNIGSNKYLRIQASYIGDDSSVVVNETEDNVYAEYIYVNDKWERVGSAKNGANGHTPVKGVDYFTEADKSEIIEEVTASIDVNSDSANAIPDYWQSALDEGVEAINTALMTAGYNKSAFLFYSDVHWNYGSQMSPKLLKYLYQHTGMTKTNFGGDIVNDEATDYDGMEYLWEWRNQLKDLPNHHSVVGNHDDGNSTNNLFSEQYVYGYLLAAEETPEIVRGAEGMYYYIDHSPEKTRYLYLDTAYKGATDKQHAFVKEALLSTPEGWHIVAVSHIWHDTIYSGANREVGDLNANASVFLAMFDNYNSRIGDYADCGGWVEFCIGGHTHLDHDSTSSTGIPIILVATDSQHTGGGTSFTYGTDTEASVNGIIADYDNHKIYVVRIGRGESRTIDVTNYVVTYTNVLPTSIDTDGSVYNGVGYKANVRWSTSSNAESTYEGAYLSGYISAPAGDIVRLKNITMSNKDTTNKLCCIYFCPSLGDMSNCLQNASTIGQWASPVWDDDGNLKQFTSTTATKYIRLQAAYIGPDSVVTINEPLE